jgi:hypothetical protein
MAEGRQGKSSFDVKAYADNYADLRKAYGEDWSKYYLHYIKYGKAEGRVAVKKTEELNYDAVFDASYYLEKYGDLKAAYGTDETKALQHFINYGMKEGRQANAEFNVQIYQSRYADLRNAYGDDLEKYYIHYIKYGKKEGRSAV